MKLDRPVQHLAPLPRKGIEHWGRVHVEADRRKPFVTHNGPRDRVT